MISASRTILFALLAAAAGCASPPPDPAAGNPQELVRQGRFEQAAGVWLERAGDAAPDEAARLRLHAADALWRAGLAGRAWETLNAIAPPLLAADDRTRRSLLLVRIALADADALGAFEELPPLADLLDLPDPAPGLELAVRAAREAGLAMDEIRLRAALDTRLAEPGENRETLWGMIRALPGKALRRPPAGTAGWFELERLTREHRADFPGFSAAVRSWRKRHPDHPAGDAIVAGLLAQARREGVAPSHVALLLPLTGTFAAAASAVRDGFLAAWYDDPGERPVVSLYDTGLEGPEAAWRTAAARGADFVVGPLRKESIARVAAMPERSVPALLLNALDAPPRPAAGEDGARPLFQFALSPEDEAREVAALARSQGHARAGLLAPGTDWGERIARAFSEDWKAAGGTVEAVSLYRAVAADPAARPVEELLDIGSSRVRARQLRRAVRRPFIHEPQPRTDLDFVFFAGFPREARQLLPRFEFFRAADLPVYATSHVFSGVPEPQQDSDLDGVVFSDMPWVLGKPAGRKNRNLHKRIVTLWPQASGGFTRYFAFGADAYLLQARIHRMAVRPAEALSGHTGRLTVGAGARVRIERTQARFRDGVPVPIPPAT